ncbi:hypothetical protein [Basfia succiniciproducens]|uniref:hypothetical protein n=1 Tax=Basfia succiniciproducens TaxID=653940 RepID=UPI0008CB4B13|nr:hypothetical protein [Basfia succiniciproducens]SEQ59478.1 hypothetical protein SAMN02910415_01724 [Basfia succiniciproducens]
MLEQLIAQLYQQKKKRSTSRVDGSVYEKPIPIFLENSFTESRKVLDVFMDVTIKNQ